MVPEDYAALLVDAAALWDITSSNSAEVYWRIQPVVATPPIMEVDWDAQRVDEGVVGQDD